MHFNVFVQPFFSAMELVLKLMQVTCVIYFFFLTVALFWKVYVETVDE